jgi:hypothetical protein
MLKAKKSFRRKEQIEKEDRQAKKRDVKEKYKLNRNWKTL